jgi:CheY-like chemotaxis protein
MLTGAHVLLVDDDVDTVEMYVYTLTRFGATVATAASVRAAIESFQQRRPDVLISDISLSHEEDGYALIRLVRALDLDEGGAVPAIALTGWVADEDRDGALAAGFTAHRSKPCDPVALAEIVRRQLDAVRQQG